MPRGGALPSRTPRLVMRRFQLIVGAVLGGAAVAFFAPSTTDRPAAAALKGLPRWYLDIDTNGDGQVSLREWLAAGRPREDFDKYDRNHDGFIAPEEVLQGGADGARLDLVNGRASFSGDIEISTSEAYRNRRAFRAFSLRLAAGKTYQIEMVSPVYWAALFLES